MDEEIVQAEVAKLCQNTIIMCFVENKVIEPRLKHTIGVIFLSKNLGRSYLFLKTSFKEVTRYILIISPSCSRLGFSIY